MELHVDLPVGIMIVILAVNLLGLGLPKRAELHV